MKSTFLYFILLFPLFIFSQKNITGIVIEQNSNNERVPLFGANVFWLNTTVGAMTADDGSFKLPYDTSYEKLVISYIGFRTSNKRCVLRSLKFNLKPQHIINGP